MEIPLAASYLKNPKKKANHYISDWLLNYYVVGAVGFEPTASCSQGRRANQAALRPDEKTFVF